MTQGHGQPGWCASGPGFPGGRAAWGLIGSSALGSGAWAGGGAPTEQQRGCCSRRWARADAAARREWAPVRATPCADTTGARRPGRPHQGSSCVAQAPRESMHPGTDLEPGFPIPASPAAATFPVTPAAVCVPPRWRSLPCGPTWLSLCPCGVSGPRGGCEMDARLVAGGARAFRTLMAVCRSRRIAAGSS